MNTKYNGFKVTFADGQFPVYRSTWEEANSDAGRYFLTTGKEAKVWGFVGDTLHLIKTWRKASRT